jgi:deaminated glutathione amidase
MKKKSKSTRKVSSPTKKSVKKEGKPSKKAGSELSFFQTTTITAPRVAAIQMNSTPDPEVNLNEARRLFDEALAVEPNIIAFPENFLLFTSDSDLSREKAQTLKGEWVEILAEWAAEADVWLLAGSIPLKAAGKKVTNTSLFFSPEGEIVSRYDKIHLFDVTVAGDQSYQESKSVQAGKKPVDIDTPWGRLGLSICYDLRFPELFRHYAKKECEMIFIPSAFTEKTGQAHWDVLTRARAIENQAYVIAPAQFGSPYDGRRCYGHARIVDPWGRVIAERKDGPGVVWADLDYAELVRVRTDLPALENRVLK